MGIEETGWFFVGNELNERYPIESLAGTYRALVASFPTKNQGDLREAFLTRKGHVGSFT